MDHALLDLARDLGAQEDGLAVATTIRDDGSIQGTVVNAGILAHPVTGERTVGFVARSGTKKLDHLRKRPQATVVFRSGWQWVAVEGEVELAGPDDVESSIPADEVPQLLRQVYAAAVGGKPDDWRSLDPEMAAERHTAVLLRPTRVCSNPTASPE